MSGHESTGPSGADKSAAQRSDGIPAAEIHEEMRQIHTSCDASQVLAQVPELGSGLKEWGAQSKSRRRKSRPTAPRAHMGRDACHRASDAGARKGFEDWRNDVMLQWGLSNTPLAQKDAPVIRSTAEEAR